MIMVMVMALSSPEAIDRNLRIVEVLIQIIELDLKESPVTDQAE